MSFGIPEGLRLVVITPDDPATRRRGLAAIVADVAAAGVSSVMFREKSLEDEAFVELAIDCRAACRRHDVGFILNERVRLASRIDPDAVHLTHRSPSVADARASLGHDVILGASTHEAGEIERAGGVDYVVYGPVFSTPSKDGVIEPRGIEALGEACRLAAPAPVVAIGGLVRENLAEAMRAGASGIAVIGAVFRAADPAAAVERLRREWSAASE